MTRFMRVCLWVLSFALVGVQSASAQSEPAQQSITPPAHLSVVEGQVFLEREGRSEAAVANVPVLEGDRVRTEEGRAEIMLSDGSLLHVDSGTKAELMSSDLIRLLQGRITLTVIGARDPSRAIRYQVDAPAASVQTNGPGEYRVAAAGASIAPRVELSVVRGSATLANDAGSVDVRAGERSAAAEGEAPARPMYFNSARWDDFDRWSAERRDAQFGATSAQYLPQDLDSYAGTFDRYGTWRQEASDGYVWFPTVPSGWRPYSVGYWRPYDEYGSFWISADPWGWPTHHYGRWGFSARFGWYWIPARSWAASWVYWALADDYVSWCPLGFNDYPVFGHWGVRGAYAGLYDAWYGWTVIPRRHFGSSVFASRVAIDGHGFDSRGRAAFVAQRRPPIVGYASRRGQSIATAPGKEAEPRRGGMSIGDPDRGGRRAIPSATQRAVTGGGAAAAAGQPVQTGEATRRGFGRSSGSVESTPPTSRATARESFSASPRQPMERAAPRELPNSAQRQSYGNVDRVNPRDRTTWAPGNAAEATSRRQAAPVPSYSGRQAAPMPSYSERQPVPMQPRAEPRGYTREPSWSPPPAGADRAGSRIYQGPPAGADRGRSRSYEGPPPGPSRAPDRGMASPRRESPPPSAAPPAPSRYNPGSATPRSSGGGGSSSRRGRGGHPE